MWRRMVSWLLARGTQPPPTIGGEGRRVEEVHVSHVADTPPPNNAQVFGAVNFLSEGANLASDCRVFLHPAPPGLDADQGRMFLLQFLFQRERNGTLRPGITERMDIAEIEISEYGEVTMAVVYR